MLVNAASSSVLCPGSSDVMYTRKKNMWKEHSHSPFYENKYELGRLCLVDFAYAMLKSCLVAGG